MSKKKSPKSIPLTKIPPQLDKQPPSSTTPSTTHPAVMKALPPSEGTGSLPSRLGAHKCTYRALFSKGLLDARQTDVPFILGHVVHDAGDVVAAAPPSDFVLGVLVWVRWDRGRGYVRQVSHVDLRHMVKMCVCVVSDG